MSKIEPDFMAFVITCVRYIEYAAFLAMMSVAIYFAFAIGSAVCSLFL